MLFRGFHHMKTILRSIILWTFCMSIYSGILYSMDAQTAWQEILTSKQKILHDTAGQLILEQYKAFVAGTAPTIAMAVIKSIPISENNEPLADVKKMNHSRIKMLPDHPQGKLFTSSDFNAGLPYSSQIRLDLWKRLEKTIEYLDELAAEFGYKPGQIEIRVFEGLRDVATQAKLFADKVNEIKCNKPQMSDNDAEIEAAKWVSPVKNNIPVHSTGAAIDFWLWDNEKQEVVDVCLV